MGYLGLTTLSVNGQGLTKGEEKGGWEEVKDGVGVRKLRVRG